MPQDLKENNEVWKSHTRGRKPGLVTLFTKPEGTVFPRSSSSTGREQLCVEDLEAAPRQYSTPVHKLNRSSLSRQFPHGSSSLESAIATGNFTVYQGGDLNEFFGCDVFAPTRVSEVCLVNDHYILVKIPETGRTQTGVQSEMAHKTLRNQRLTTVPEEKETQPPKKFSRYLQCGNGRNHRVSPTPIESNKLWGTDDCIQEVFESRTVITGKLKVPQPESTTKQEEPSSFQTAKVTDPTNDTECYTREPSSTSTFKTPLQTSLDDRVELEVHGRLETPPGDSNETRKSSCKQMLPRPRRPFGVSFSWFLRSFRLRLSSKKPTKTKKKIHAVVYKTFFVTWTKPAGHSSCSDCCGIKRTLRRTRSAVF